ncbi:hypothetical protein FVER53590_03703 [Fusarium verticillioides]|nr:hypothetical protein FVER53590_03703 [Fusarium verticillioides]
MAGNAPGPSVLEEANPTVRLKGKEGEYADTLEYDTFQSRGGNPEDLMDEERWLDFPAHVRSPLQKSKMSKSDGDTPLPPTGKYGMRNIWNPEPVSGLGNDRISKVDIGRKMTETHLAVELAARACHSISSIQDDIKLWLGIASGTQLTTDNNVNGVFVGISALNYNAIFMKKSGTQHFPDGFNGLSRQQAIKNSLDLDNTELVELVFETGFHIQGHEIIWTENMLIPGNISYAKRALHDHLDDDEKGRFLQVMRRENHLLLSGNGPAGVAKTLPSNEDPSRKPLICRAIQGGKDYNNLHFTLRWPPMALLEFPGDMISNMQSFLDRYPSDNVPLNLALAATIIYFDIEETPDHEMEGFVDSFPRAPKWLFTTAVRRPRNNCIPLTGHPTIAYWNTTTPETVKALTGPARAIGPVFPDLGSSYYNTRAIASCAKRWFGDETCYTQNFQFCRDNPEFERKNMARRADELIRIADRLGIPPNERKTSTRPCCLSGMRLAALQYYTPPAKRAQPVEPTLSSDIKGEILQTIKGLAAISCDWDNLLKDLQTPAPTIKAIQESFSQVRLFVSELEKTLQNKNDGNGKGDLDHVIRLVFRAEGLFGSGVEAMDYESKWSQHRARLSQLFGQPTGDAIEAVFRLRDTPDAFGIILPQIQVLGESSLIKDQVEAFKKIEALLGQPLSDNADETASGGTRHNNE